MRFLGIIALAAISFGLLGQPAMADKRVALVIGNSAYQKVTPLTNPGNDSGVMAETLKNAGFDVVDLKRDLNVNQMRRTLREFSDRVRDADVAVVYYAGHGMEIDGTNYLVPVDAVLGSRAVGRGLAKVEPSSPNTLIAFAAKAGSTASDGDSKNSPFTAALVKYLPKPGLDLRKAFGFTRDDVLKATNNRQEPFVYGSLGGDDVALVPASNAGTPASPVPDPNSAIRRDYELAERVGTKPVWDSFITNYPNGFYTELAKAQRDKLAAEETRVAATQKAKAAQEEQTRLAIEGAKAAEQAKAALQARAAEQARVAAELAKKDEEAKVAEAERAKAAALAKAADDARAADDKLKKADEAKAAEEAKLAAAKMKDDRPVGPIATLTPSDDAARGAPNANQPASADIPRLLQAELRRVGCNTGAIDGNWDIAAQRSLSLFNKNAGMKLDVKIASLDALDAVRSKTARICPLICDHGYKPDGERCVKITCKAGSFLNDDNTCEKKHDKPVAAREEPPAKRVPSQRKDADHSTSQPPGTGQTEYLIIRGAGRSDVAAACRIHAFMETPNGTMVHIIGKTVLVERCVIRRRTAANHWCRSKGLDGDRLERRKDSSDNFPGSPEPR